MSTGYHLKSTDIVAMKDITDFKDITGADPGFQVRGGGAHLKKLGQAEVGAKIVGVFRVKNHPWIRPCIPKPD